jgi:hypothetical protein
MVSKTRKRTRTRKCPVSSTSVWGKNPALERFWGDLASGKRVVVVYTDGKHNHIQLPNRTTKKYQTVFAEFEEDPTIAAVLSSNMSQDAYELFLYPKAKKASVEEVIRHYTKYFKPMMPGEKLRIPF